MNMLDYALSEAPEHRLFKDGEVETILSGMEKLKKKHRRCSFEPDMVPEEPPDDIPPEAC